MKDYTHFDKVRGVIMLHDGESVVDENLKRDGYYAREQVGKITFSSEKVIDTEIRPGKEYTMHGDYEDKQDPYTQLGEKLGALAAEKQKAYGDSFGKAGGVLKLLYPDGVNPEQYTDMLCVVRILDKLFRIATDKNAFGESPYNDVVGYGLLGIVKDMEKRGKNDEVINNRS